MESDIFTGSQDWVVDIIGFFVLGSILQPTKPMNNKLIFLPTNRYQWRRLWHPIPVLVPGKSHGRRSLVGCSPWGLEDSDTTERLHFHFSLSCIGEGNGNPFQCSCLENPRDRGAWWAAVHAVAQSQTRLKRFSSNGFQTECENHWSSVVPSGIGMQGFSENATCLWEQNGMGRMGR